MVLSVNIIYGIGVNSGLLDFMVQGKINTPTRAI